jgi:hypothetical protein
MHARLRGWAGGQVCVTSPAPVVAKMPSKFKVEHTLGTGALASVWLPAPACLTLRRRVQPLTEKRKAEADRIRDKYPDRIPVRRALPCLSAGVPLSYSG